jgi:hypothetical protein
MVGSEGRNCYITLLGHRVSSNVLTMEAMPEKVRLAVVQAKMSLHQKYLQARVGSGGFYGYIEDTCRKMKEKVARMWNNRSW